MTREEFMIAINPYVRYGDCYLSSHDGGQKLKVTIVDFVGFDQNLDERYREVPQGLLELRNKLRPTGGRMYKVSKLQDGTEITWSYTSYDI